LATRAISAARRTFQPFDIGDDHAPQPRVVDMLEPDLETGDVLLGLLDEGEVRRQLCQPLVRRDRWRLQCGGTGCDPHRVESIVLGPAQTQPSIGLDLGRL
jgi:hypothetical protein